MKTYCIGDPHGNYKGFMQVMKSSGFDYEKDRLICLGDVVDGWGQVPELIEELLKIKNLVSIKGNHDDWAYQWLKYGIAQHIWLSQGGQATFDAYTIYHPDLMIKHEKEFFAKQVYYYVDEDNRAYIHGGFNWKIPLKDNEKSDIIWDRNLYYTALYWQFQHDYRNEELNTVKEFKEVFIGHTTTNYSFNHKFNCYIPSDKPVHVSNVWNLDTGSGYEGKLTLINVDTKEYFQSNNVGNLYPDEKGRR